MEDKKALIVCLAGTFVVYHGGKWMYTSWRSRQQSKQLESMPFVQIGKLDTLTIYPIKSCRGMKVPWLDCDSLGVHYNGLRDRHCMIIDGANGEFYTARKVPEMILIESSWLDGRLTLSCNGDKVTVNFDDAVKRNDVRRGKLFHGEQTDGFDCGDDVSAFLDKAMGRKDSRLIFYRPGMYNERVQKTKPGFWNNNIVPNREDDVAYCDAAPFHITTESSLNELQKRLDHKVSHANFRANFVFSGCAAWDEDAWSDVRIAAAQLQLFQPCTRCIMPCVDPETGKRIENQKPLRTLKEFRLAPDGPMRTEFKEDPMFGVYAGLSTSGRVSQGDAVWVRYKLNGPH